MQIKLKRQNFSLKTQNKTNTHKKYQKIFFPHRHTHTHVVKYCIHEISFPHYFVLRNIRLVRSLQLWLLCITHFVEIDRNLNHALSLGSLQLLWNWDLVTSFWVYDSGEEQNSTHKKTLIFTTSSFASVWCVM